MTLADWLLLTPLVPALLLVLYMAWQAFKEIKPFVQSLKNLQQQIGETKENVKSLLADIQSSKEKTAQQAQNAQQLISYSRETYSQVKQVVGAVRSLDTLPVHRAVTYFKQRREDERLPNTLAYLKRKARNVNTKLDQSEFSQLPALAGVILSAAALIFAFRRTR